MSSTACGEDDQKQTFKITHPSHPLRDVELNLEHYTCCWSEDRAFFYDKKGHLNSVPVGWTNLCPADIFIKISAGRSYFKVENLLQIVEIIRSLKNEL